MVSCFAPLRGRRPKRKPRPDKLCMAGCGHKIPQWQWLCDLCFGELPGARKKEICEARLAKQHERVFGLSRGAADFLRARRDELANQ